MTDLLQQSSAWLESQRCRHMTVPVTYRRGEQQVQVLATIGQTVFWIDDGAGGRVRIQSRDYLITAADLVLDETPVLPVRGDQILEGALTYEVLSPADEPCWRYSDPYRQTLRIHTKGLES